MMRSLCWLLLAAMLATMLAIGGPVAAQTPAEADGAAIRDVIQRQIDAFRRDDGPTAFGFAAPAIQSMYGSPDLFLDAVRQGYRPVYRPRQVEFRELGIIDGATVQQVYVVGPDNEPRLALYFMEKQPDGSWRIAGCFLLEFEGQSA